MKSIEVINTLEYEEFINHFGNVIESCPQLASGLWLKRPFRNLDHMYACLVTIVDELPESGHVGMLKLISDIAGRLAQEGKLSRESFKEQTSAGLNTLSPLEKSTITKYNAAYKAKFGFPFVICARENKKEAILRGMEERLMNTHRVEVKTGVEEIKKIAYLRLCDLVCTSDVCSKL